MTKLPFVPRRQRRGQAPQLSSGQPGPKNLIEAIARADFAQPTASRYLYIGAVFVLLIAAETTAGDRPRAFALGLGAILLAGALIANLAALRAGERGLRASDDSAWASLAAVQIAAPLVSPRFQPNPANAPQITAGPYLAAGGDLGSPALTLPELESAPKSLVSRRTW